MEVGSLHWIPDDEYVIEGFLLQRLETNYQKVVF